MTTEPFGPAGKKHRQNLSFDERTEAFQKEFGFEIEPEPTQDAIPPESAWDVDRKSWWTGYLKRNPQARPKPNQILKGTGPLVAPNTTAGDILEKLIPQIAALITNHAKFVERLNQFESEVEKEDPCYAEHGPGWRMIDRECVKLNVSDEGQNAPARKSMESATVDSIMSKVLRKGRLFTKAIALDEPWEIVS